MVDLFSPFSVRGEVQKRISGKVYGVIFTDLVYRAVHIESVYDRLRHNLLRIGAQPFCKYLRMQQLIDSDPGSQLVGAELTEAWEKIDREELHKKSVPNGPKWIFGPADSP